MKYNFYIRNDRSTAVQSLAFIHLEQLAVTLKFGRLTITATKCC